MTQSNLITNLKYRYEAKPRLSAAFKRLRKEGYSCRIDVLYWAEYTNQKSLYIYTEPVVRYKPWNGLRPLKFYYKGDIELIEGILQSEGVVIGLVDSSRLNPHPWFCICADFTSNYWN